MILHLDLDCFFAAAHRIDNKGLHNIPIAVGSRSNLSIFDVKKETRYLSDVDGAFTSSIVSSNSGKTFENYFLDDNRKVRGIITTSSYEARKYGIKTAMSVSQALQLCPHLVVIPPNYPLYHELSNRLKKLLEKEIPSIEQFSIDEFFGDVSGWIDDDDVESFAFKLRDKIQNDLGLPISIGISKTKWIAKLATTDSKPFGVKYIKPCEVEPFTHNMKIENFPGIGKGYQEKLHKKGIFKLGDIKKHKKLFYNWGKNGIQLYNRICGIDNEKISISQSKKSIGLGRTFDPIESRDEIKRRITILCRHLSFLSFKGNHNPMTYSLSIRYEHGYKVNDSINSNRLFNEQNFKQSLSKLFDKVDIHISHKIMQLNINLSNFEENKLITMDILNIEEDMKQSKITNSMQKLRDKFGIDIIKTAIEIDSDK